MVELLAAGGCGSVCATFAGALLHAIPAAAKLRMATTERCGVLRFMVGPFGVDAGEAARVDREQELCPRALGEALGLIRPWGDSDRLIRRGAHETDSSGDPGGKTTCLNGERIVKRASIAVLTLPLLLFSTAAIAHDTWLIPESAAATVGADVAFDLTSGMAFPALDHAIEPDRLELASCWLKGQNVPLTKVPGEKSLRLTARFTVPGVAVCRVDLRPKELELKPEQVAHYLDEIGAPDSVRQAWAAMKPQRWLERYAKHAKTFVAVGDAGDDDAWARPGESPFEFVPESNPSAVRAGGEIVVRLLKGGAPLAGFAVGVIREGEKVAASRRTDTGGRVRIPVARPGRYLLRATEIRPPGAAGGAWESDFTTLTFSVR